MQTLEILTKSDKETKKLGRLLAQAIERSSTSLKRAFVISLEGELGSGKTTFVQGFAKGLGVKENPRSPTFVIMQVYPIISTKPPPGLPPKGRRSKSPLPWEGARGRFIHIDAYRLRSKDFKVLNWNDFIKDKKNVILVEWGNKIKNVLPRNSLRIIFKHVRHKEQRLIKIVI